MPLFHNLLLFLLLLLLLVVVVVVIVVVVVLIDILVLLMSLCHEFTFSFDRSLTLRRKQIEDAIHTEDQEGEKLRAEQQQLELMKQQLEQKVLLCYPFIYCCSGNRRT